MGAGSSVAQLCSPFVSQGLPHQHSCSLPLWAIGKGLCGSISQGFLKPTVSTGQPSLQGGPRDQPIHGGHQMPSLPAYCVTPLKHLLRNHHISPKHPAKGQSTTIFPQQARRWGTITGNQKKRSALPYSWRLFQKQQCLIFQHTIFKYLPSAAPQSPIHASAAQDRLILILTDPWFLR